MNKKRVNNSSRNNWSICLTIASVLLLLVQAASAQTVENYNWRMVNDLGASNPVDLQIHPTNSSVMYMASGDTGLYKWDNTNSRWRQLSDWSANVGYSRVSGFALDPSNSNIVYYTAGDAQYSVSDCIKSTDGGLTWTLTQMKKSDGSVVRTTGNEDGSSCAPRLAIDPNNSNIIYFASRIDGLYKTTTAAAPANSWAKVASLPARGDVAYTYDAGGSATWTPHKMGGLAFVVFDKNGGTVSVGGQTVTRYIYVGVAGDLRQQAGNGQPVTILSEGGLWCSSDGGVTWSRKTTAVVDLKSRRGVVSTNGTVFFSGHNTVYKCARTDTSLTALTLPVTGNFTPIAVNPSNANELITGVQAWDPNNKYFRSVDGGANWSQLSLSYAILNKNYKTFPLMGVYLTFDPNAASTIWTGDWNSAWKCTNISGTPTIWTQQAEGHNGSYLCGLSAPPSLPGHSIASVLSRGADYDGYRYASLSATPPKRLTSDKYNVDGTADGTSADFCESDPRWVAGCGGWDHGLFGGAGGSSDNGVGFAGFSDGGLYYHQKSSSIKLGRVAVGATKQANGKPIIVRIPRFGVPRYSTDWGTTWTNSTGAPSGMTPSEWDAHQTLAADRVDGNKFYAFANTTGRAQIFRTTDGGATWSLASEFVSSWSGRTYSHYNLKACPGRNGELWLTLIDVYSTETHEGLYRSTDSGTTWTKISITPQVYGFALGAPAPTRTNPAFYYFGGDNRIYKSDDLTSTTGNGSGATWKIIWDYSTTTEKQLIRAQMLLEADRQVYGRVFAGANARGLHYGEPVASAAPAAPATLEIRSDYNKNVIHWQDPSGATSYKLWRSTTSGGQGGTAYVSGLTKGTYVDSSVTAGTTYYYRVSAVNSFGEGAKSQEVAAMPYYQVPVSSRFGTAGNGSSTFDKASDANTATAFDATDPSAGYTGIDSGSNHIVARIRYWPRLWQGTRMVNGQFQGSSAQTGPWTTIYTVPSAPADGMFTEAMVGSSTPYRYYRYYSPANGHANIMEMEFYYGGIQSGELLTGSDVNGPGVAGTTTFVGPTWSVAGSGTDITGVSDKFQFAHQFVTGDCTVITKVDSQQNTSGWAKCGIMVREKLTGGSRHFFAHLTPSNGCRLNYRSAENGSTTDAAAYSGIAAPHWLRIVRTGNSFVATKSADGITWTTLGSATISMNADVYVGLAVCSLNNSVLNTSVFSNFSVK